MNAAILELRSGGLVAVKFLTREACDTWADKHDAEVLAWAPLVSLTVAADHASHA